MPNLPAEVSTNINIDQEGLVSLLLMSIALEELSLAHVVNAQGEILQQFARFFDKKCYKFNEILKLNRSVGDNLRIVLEKEKTLKEKLLHVISYKEDYVNDEQSHYHHHDCKNESNHNICECCGKSREHMHNKSC